MLGRIIGGRVFRGFPKDIADKLLENPYVHFIKNLQINSSGKRSTKESSMDSMDYLLQSQTNLDRKSLDVSGS